ncbi:hypothetical protein J6590_009648 [Homalodisca vitripennis]|nr:hypothetical protein J6590_009648 [Homalodisca vitripennis]
MFEIEQNHLIRLIGLRLRFEYRNVPIDDLQLQFNLRPLHSRRKVHDLLFLKKLICSLLDFRESHPRLFARRHYYTQHMFHSPFLLLQRLAKNLPGHLTSSV